MEDVYKTPDADLVDAPSVADYGSVERAVVGDYEFRVGAVLEEAWEKTGGNKLRLWLCIFVYAILTAICNLLLQTASYIGVTDPLTNGVIEILSSVVYYLLAMPLGIGFAFLGVRIACDSHYSVSNLFDFYPRTWKIFLTYLLMVLLISLGFLLLVIPGIYLAVAYIHAVWLTADKGLGARESLRISRQAVSKRWWTMFGFFFLMGIIVMVSAIPLLIGLIWTIPMGVIAGGIVYRNIFGVNAETLAKA